RNLPVRFIYEEYRIRHLFGDRPDVGTYKMRFPGQFAQFMQLLQLQPATPILTPPGPTPATPAGGVRSGTAAPGGGRPIGEGYSLIKRIGSGGFGEVWLAEAPGGFPAAVKIIYRPLDHAEAQRELQSLQLMKRLRHACLLQTQAYWSLEDRL